MTKLCSSNFFEVRKSYCRECCRYCLTLHFQHGVLHTADVPIILPPIMQFGRSDDDGEDDEDDEEEDDEEDDEVVIL